MLKKRVYKILLLTLAALMPVMAFSPGCALERGKIMWFEHSTKKILADQAEPYGRDTYELYVAGNEYEGCQVAVNLPETCSDFTLVIAGEGIVPGAGSDTTVSAEIYREHFISAPKYTPFFQVEPEKEGLYEEYPDPLSPLNGTLTVRAHETTPFYILVHAGKEAAPGDYKAVITAKSGDNVLGKCTLKIHVWAFRLSDTPAMSAVSDLSAYEISKVSGVSGDELQVLYEKYYDFMAEHKISPYSLPYDVLDERADKFIDDPRITGFRVRYGDDDYLRAVREKLLSVPGRLEKAYFYFLDEPSNEVAYMNLVDKSRHLLSVFPEARIVSPFFVDPDMFTGEDAIEYSTGSVNIWCPKLHCFDSFNIYNEAQQKRLKPLKERLSERRSMGEDVWTYVCWEPGEPYLNLYVNMPGIRHRLIFWQNYMLNANGFLYWSSNYWTRIKDPWTDMNTVSNLSPNVFGDGSLIYNGDKVGVDGACPSLRLEIIRDGIDDYEYMTMLEEAGVNREELLDMVAHLTPSLTEYTSDDYMIYRARIAMGNVLERLERVMNNE
ncbi:MAG: DUF4091 domain-containing protein [Clostridia bacterium]|nr:DUF4091 domain-containing protein [Clostridia bacterium]